MACDDPWPRNDVASNIALGVTTLGLVLVVVGCLWPIDPYYTIDPSLTAAENEEREGDFVWRVNALFLVAVLGMACLLVGGVLTTYVICRMMWVHEAPEVCPQQNPIRDGVAMTQRTDRRPAEMSKNKSSSDGEDQEHLVERDHLQDYGSTAK